MRTDVKLIDKANKLFHTKVEVPAQLITYGDLEDLIIAEYKDRFRVGSLEAHLYQRVVEGLQRVTGLPLEQLGPDAELESILPVTNRPQAWNDLRRYIHVELPSLEAPRTFQGICQEWGCYLGVSIALCVLLFLPILIMFGALSINDYVARKGPALLQFYAFSGVATLLIGSVMWNINEIVAVLAKNNRTAIPLRFKTIQDVVDHALRNQHGAMVHSTGVFDPEAITSAMRRLTWTPVPARQFEYNRSRPLASP